MPRVSGVDIPPEKKTRISLRYVYGIGPAHAAKICEELGLDPEAKAKTLSEEDVTRVANYIEKNFPVEGHLRRQLARNINRLKEIGCYRGLRHRRSLPVRGQRTRSNARSRKGPKKTVAGKKPVKVK